MNELTMSESTVQRKLDLDKLIKRLDPNPHDLSIAINDLQHYYGERETRTQILHDIDLDITSGEIVIITGPSGCGKTTLLTLIGTLRSVIDGSIKVLGTELNGLDSAGINRMRKNIGFIFQAHNLFESLTAFQNVKMACELLNMSAAESKTRIEQTLTSLGLGDRIHYKPDSLSGGQKQRVAVARGIIHRPKLLLADEPTAALDASSTNEVINMFRQLANEYHTTILIVTHDDRILKVADRIVNLGSGHIMTNIVTEKVQLIARLLVDFEHKTDSELKLFSQLTPATLTDVADKMQLRQYVAGDTIIRQGETGNEFFVIARGDVDIIVDEEKVAQLHAGAFFGEIALIKDEPRNATVRAVSDVVCFILDKDEFQNVLKASVSFEEALRRAMFERTGAIVQS
jgi:putative ABC transport system ATP-binding protein